MFVMSPIGKAIVIDGLSDARFSFSGSKYNGKKKLKDMIYKYVYRRSQILVNFVYFSLLASENNSYSQKMIDALFFFFFAISLFTNQSPARAEGKKKVTFFLPLCYFFRLLIQLLSFPFLFFFSFSFLFFFFFVRHSCFSNCTLPLFFFFLPYLLRLQERKTNKR